METLSIDQHDKWKRFGLFLHCAIDTFSGKMHWLKVWWTNRNPVLIGSYYFEAARENRGNHTTTCILPFSDSLATTRCSTQDSRRPRKRECCSC